MFATFNKSHVNQHADHITNILEAHHKKISDKLIENTYQFLRFHKETYQQLPFASGVDWWSYCLDRQERSLLTLNTLRESGDEFITSESHGHLPVLEFKSELVIDGKNLKNPVNYVLLRILPKTGVAKLAPEASKASPVIIIDPRAGHGPGIGGFKQDSEVGVALAANHPVYFVSFKDKPEPNQTTTHVVMAHAHFIEHVIQCHPQADKPIVIGNCQGGWAGALVSATHPDLIGALVLNGSPLSYWAGKDGQNPMRYLGGMLGGALPAIISADLSDGTFDGANLVMNFEALNPANTWFRKYKDLFDKVDTESERFKEFDKWWSGFYLMNSSEIRWILDNLFIGNKLAKGEVTLDNAMRVNLDRIHSPVFVFASWGDNITPPAQALGWITDAYRDITTLKQSGKRIIYTLHNAIGHLGIFVSKQIAQREHQAISSIIDYAKALPPGLYEMVIEQEAAPPVVRFYERNFTDIKNLEAQYPENQEFEIIKNNSEILEQWYDSTLGPFFKSTASPWRGELQRKLHPLRVRRTMLSSQNPWMAGVEVLSKQVKKRRDKNFISSSISAKNPYEEVENTATNWLESFIQLFSTTRDAMFEITFHQIYGGIAALDQSHHRKNNVHIHSKKLDATQFILNDGLDSIRRATVRMVLLLIKARGGMRGAHLLTFKKLLDEDPHYTALNSAQKEALLSHETAIVAENSSMALDHLAQLLINPNERKVALKLLESVVGKADQLSEAPRKVMLQIQALLKISKNKSSRKPSN